jgi:glycosyltransferase involved in cell wall biosynthesis
LQGPFVAGSRRGFVDGIDVIELELPYSNVDSFLRRSLTFLRFVLRSIRLALAPGYDVLFATSTPLTIALPGIAAKILKHRRFIFEVRDLWPELPRAMGVIRNRVVLKLMDLLETWAYREADACIGLAPGIVEGIRRKSPRKRIAMIPNGSDLDPGVQDSLLPEHLEIVLKKSEGKLRCIYAGTHGIANGLDAVLNAAGELRRRGRSDIAILLVGDGMLKPSLQVRANSEGLDNCTFVEPIPKRMLIVLQRHIDVGLMTFKNVPSFYDGTSPNKFFDYLASGLPILINYPGWLASHVRQEQCGIVVPPDDANAFANALEWFADSPNKRREMGTHSRRLAQQAFGRDELASQFIQFIESTVDRKSS